MLKGVGASAGIGIGKVICIREQSLDYSQVAYQGKDKEKERLKQAAETFCEITQKMAEDIRERVGQKESEILTGQVMMLQDPFMMGQMEDAINSGSCAEAAVDSVCQMYIEMFSNVEDELMKQLAAGGFKDITRIASSSPTMWQHICLNNHENISHILQRYIDMLTEAKATVDNEDAQALYQLFDSSRSYRNSIPGGSSGPIKKVFAVYCDIIDEAGGIATIATILASNNINIKNIGIVHNREFEEGVLRIEFYDDASSKKAAGLLQKYRYIVYERQ